MAKTAAPSARTGRRSPLASVALLVIGLLATGGAYALFTTSATAETSSQVSSMVSEGQKLLAANCAGCHGDKAEGGNAGPTLSGPDFTNGYKDGNASALYNKISMDMPSSAPGSLTPEQYADVMAYVLNVNKYPAGQAEIPKDGAGLKTVKMAAPKA
jgi:ubiquinol-cytochrome c reductase cytochrome c subunit